MFTHSLEKKMKKKDYAFSIRRWKNNFRTPLTVTIGQLVKFISSVLEVRSKYQGFLLTSFSPHISGLPVLVNAVAGSVAPYREHNPFVLVHRDRSTAVNIEPPYAVVEGEIDDPFLMAQLSKFLEIHKVPLLEYWNGEIDSVDLCNQIERTRVTN